MLKLEKVAKTLQISVTLRKKESILTKNLTLALLFATLLHLAAFFLFQITPFIFKESQKLILPVVVDSVIIPPLSEGGVVAQIDEDLFPRTIKEPRKSEPHLPDWPEERGQFPLLGEVDTIWQKDPFEKIGMLPNLDPPFPKKGVQTLFSGPLGEVPLLYIPPLPPQLSTYQGQFLARLESRNGRLFWFEPLQKDPLDPTIENWLKEFRFQPSENSFIEVGMVEVQIG